MMRWGKTTIAAILCIAVTAPNLTDCSFAPRPTETVDSVVATLAKSGIGVFSNFSGGQPVAQVAGQPSPIKLTFWQAQNLAREVDDHNGYLGAQYDALARMPKGAPPFSYFIASWILGARSTGAREAARIMGKQDYKYAPQVVFPMLVMLLFAADAARSAPTTAFAKPSPAHWNIASILGEPAKADSTGPCTAISQFVNGVIDAVFDALKVSSDKFWAQLWNGVLELVKGVVYVVIGMAIEPLVTILTAAATAIVAVSLLVSTLHQWHAKIVARPSPNRFAIAPAPPNPGDLIVQLDTGGSKLPDEIEACANFVNASFDDIHTKGAPVAWNQIIGMPQYATQDRRDNQIQPDDTATLHYLTRVEPPPPSCAVETAGVVTVNVTVVVVDRRQVWERLWTFVMGQTLGGLPQKLEAVLQPILLPKLNKARDAIFSFQNPQAIGSVLIYYHVTPPGGCPGPQPPGPKPPAPQTPAPPTQSAGAPPCTALLLPSELEAASGRTGGEIDPTGPECHLQLLSLIPEDAEAGIHELVGHLASWGPPQVYLTPEALRYLGDGMGVHAYANSVDQLWAATPSSPCIRRGLQCHVSDMGVLYVHRPGVIVDIYYTNHETHMPDLAVEQRIARFAASRL